jgi:alpha/beta superfamily hydrolase
MNIFAFDYRGFGKSVNMHPSERSTYEDADAAWRYLTETRHLSQPRSSSMVWGWALPSPRRLPAATLRRRR